MSGTFSLPSGTHASDGLMRAAEAGNVSEVKRLLCVDSCQHTWKPGGTTHSAPLEAASRDAVVDSLSLKFSPEEFNPSRELVDNRNLAVLEAVWSLGIECVNAMILSQLESQLSPIAAHLNKEKLELPSTMHLAAFLKVPGLMTILVRRPAFVDINVENQVRQTPLHMAALTGNREAVEVLMGQPSLRGTLEDKSKQTALELAQEMDWRDIVEVLMQRQDVRDYLGLLQSDRSFLVDTGNAILVGAALIASITFMGWLQPPLGYQHNYQYPKSGGPSDDFKQYAAINEYTSIKIFWIANSLSFYLSIATLLAATGSVAPRRHHCIRKEVERLLNGIRLCGNFFIWAVVFVVIAFIAAGFAAVPPEIQYMVYMICTTVVGICVCCRAFDVGSDFYIPKSKYADPTYYLGILISKISPLLSRRRFERKSLYHN